MPTIKEIIGYQNGGSVLPPAIAGSTDIPHYPTLGTSERTGADFLAASYPDAPAAGGKEKAAGTVGQVANIGSMLSMSNPYTAAGFATVKVLSGAYKAWKADKRARKAEKETQRRYEETVKIRKQQWEYQRKQAERNFGLNLAQYKESLKQARMVRKDRTEQTNYVRTQDFTNRLTNMVNTSNVARQNFKNFWRAR